MTKKTKIWVGVGAVLLVVAAFGAYSYKQAMEKYISKSKSTEARAEVRRLFGYAKIAAEETGAFPEGKTGPVPPAGSCCKGPDGQCAPDPTLWEGEPWSTIEYTRDMPFRYSVEYEVDLAGALTVRAIGDLDCDGTFSTFSVTGTADGPAPEVIQVDPLE